jgi:hypothetical protein
LLFLSLVSGDPGNAIGPGSFLEDISVHTRFLPALSLLIFAESVCLPRLAAIARK